VAAGTIIMHFWAEQYSFAQTGQCTTLHWSVKGVREVLLSVDDEDEQGVIGEGSRSNVCPDGTMTYKLRAVANDGSTRTVTALLQAPIPDLSEEEAYLQGVITQIARVSDAETNLPGDQSGYEVTIDGVNVIDKNGSCCQQAVKLMLPDRQIADFHPPNYDDWLDWPLRVGQTVELHALCGATRCYFEEDTNGRQFYLKQTAP
jgi:hypothetical protein